MNSGTFSWRRLVFSGFAVWLLVIALGIVYLFFGSTPFRKKVHLGIDLVGGTYLTLIVRTNEAIESDLHDRLDAMKRVLKTGRKEAPASAEVHVVVDESNVRALIPKESYLTMTFKSVANAQEASNYLRTAYKDIGVFDGTMDAEKLKFSLKDDVATMIARTAVENDRDVLRTRLSQDKSNVSEISVSIHGEKSIVIELPDVKNPEIAKSMIGTPAMLEFKIVEAAGDTEDELLYKYDGVVPEGMMIIPGDEHSKFILVSRRAAVTGKYLKDARKNFTDKGFGVSFTLTPEGGVLFSELTKKNIGNPLAAILDNRVITIATINSKISTDGMITGQFDSERAESLSMLLKSGAFSAGVDFDQDRRIEPTLGSESIHNGLLSCLVSMILLLLFTIVFYSWCGILAFITLLCNLFLLLIGLVWLEATLTLPGIAGMILTVGMAVDASVLIYEHIREELAKGVAIKNAVQSGFAGAFRVIWDANITTLLAAVILYKFGAGPIQGFAVTMMLGIASTLLTGLLFLRSLFTFILDNFTVHKLRI